MAHLVDRPSALWASLIAPGKDQAKTSNFCGEAALLMDVSASIALVFAFNPRQKNLPNKLTSLNNVGCDRCRHVMSQAPKRRFELLMVRFQAHAFLLPPGLGLNENTGQPVHYGIATRWDYGFMWPWHSTHALSQCTVGLGCPNFHGTCANTDKVVLWLPVYQIEDAFRGTSSRRALQKTTNPNH